MKFIALYKAPVSVLDNWMQMSPEQRAGDEAKMKEEWNAWMEKNGSHILETAGAGKTKVVSKEGASDMRNDVMMYSLVEAESQEAAVALFEGHPHFNIPEATIEVMPANVVNGLI